MRALVFSAFLTIGGLFTIVKCVKHRWGRRPSDSPPSSEASEGESSGIRPHGPKSSSPRADKVESHHTGSAQPRSPTIRAALPPCSVLPFAEDCVSRVQLGRHFAAGHSQSLAMVRFIAANLLQLLEALHHRGVMHRDISMDSVHVDVSGLGFLSFGNLRHATSTRNTPRASPPNPHFMAPENAYGWGEGLEADIWALGVLVYRILVGQFPFPNFHLDDRGREQAFVNSLWRSGSVFDGRPELTSFFASIFQVKKEDRATIADLKQHPFFRGVDWYGLAQRTVESPLLGELES
ncbi:hypothetical protein BSKO_13229 [Bryopsis sp. KO-2023]|nr:hypothetical protein BSKO_13229 [Bryopsis sp. KO-2023]